MNEYDRVRERIAELIKFYDEGACPEEYMQCPCESASKMDCNMCYADAILALPEICVKADEQKVPLQHHRQRGLTIFHEEDLTEKSVRAYMRKQGFVRIAKREE